MSGGIWASIFSRSQKKQENKSEAFEFVVTNAADKLRKQHEYASWELNADLGKAINSEWSSGWFQDFKDRLIKCGMDEKQANSVTNLISCATVEFGLGSKYYDKMPMQDWFAKVFSDWFLNQIGTCG